MTARKIDVPRDETRPSVRQVAGMSLERFASAGLIVRVHSRLLDEVVLFASDNARLPAGQPHQVLRAADLKRLLDRGVTSRETLRSVA